VDDNEDSSSSRNDYDYDDYDNNDSDGGTTSSNGRTKIGRAAPVTLSLSVARS
jgi:hypothetical protein